MRLAEQLNFARRQLWREWKAGALSVLLLALVVAIASHTAIGHFTARIAGALSANANNIIGGDLALDGGRPARAELLTQAAQKNLRTAHAILFSSVINANDEILLVGVKAVDENYPLKGKLKIATELYGATQTVTASPPAGEAWVAARVLRTLNLTPGDAFTLGKTKLRATRILTFEPDRGGNFYGMTPRVLINQRDLQKSDIIQPASRVRYRYMFTGDARAIVDYRAWLATRLSPGQHIHALDDERPVVADAVDKAKQYMALAGLVALLLAAVAIAGGGRHYSERHYDTSALLRCMGCKQSDILVIYCAQLFIIALVGGLIGNAIGYAAQLGLLTLLAELFPQELGTARGGGLVFFSGMTLAFVVLIGFTLPSVLRLKSVSPQRVLRNDLAPLPVSAWLTVGGAVALVAAMMWAYTGNAELAAAMLGGAAVLLAAAAVLVVALLRGVNASLPRLPVALRAGMRNLVRRKRAATVQIIAFALTVMAMLVVVFIRTELLGDWRATIPDDAPNHFVLNIQAADRDRYADYLTQHQINAGELYPVVRGRLMRLNGKPMVEHVSKDEEHDESLRRDLNLTWSTDPPPDNVIIAGEWWDDGNENADGNGNDDGNDFGDRDDDGNDNEPLVSVESQLAARLNITVGDTLSLFTGEREWHARVANIRRVKWDNFKPNFYLVFNRAALNNLPTTLLNAFHLDAIGKQQLPTLVNNFPSITILEVDIIIQQVKDIIHQVTLAVEAILGFVLAAGIVVTLAAIQASMPERMREGALLRTLGAERALLRRHQWSEFAGMGLLAGLLGVFGAEAVNAVLYHRVFELHYAPTWWAWFVIPATTAALIGIAGVAVSSRVVRQSPIASLRRWGM